MRERTDCVRGDRRGEATSSLQSSDRPQRAPTESRLPTMDRIYETLRHVVGAEASSTSVGHPSACEAGGGAQKDVQKSKRTWTERWIMGVSAAGVVVSGLVLVIVLFPLLRRTPTPTPVSLSSNIPTNVVRLGPPLEDGIPEGEKIVLANQDVILEGRKSSGFGQDGEASQDTNEASEFYKRMADSITGAMNKDVDPCHDFYEYACGRWHVSEPPPKGVSRWSTFEAMTITIWELMEEQLKLVASSRSSSREETKNQRSRVLLEDADPYMLDLVGEYYAACEDEAQLSQKGVKPLQDVLQEMDNKYMVLSKRGNPLGVLQRMLEYVHHELAVHVFFSWKVEMDNSVANSMAIEITVPSLDLVPQGTIIEGNEELINVYRQYTRGLLEMVGTYNGREVSSEVEDILAMLKVYHPLGGSPLVNDTTIGELDVIAPFLNWQSFFNHGFNSLGVFMSHDERVLSLVQDYLAVVSTNIMMEIANEGSAYRLYSYIRWQVMQNYAQYLHKPARNTILPLFDGITGENTTGLPHFRYRPCIKEMEERLALPIAYLLLEIVKGQLHIQHNIKDMVNQVKWMAENIREEYKRYIASFRWLKNYAKNMLIEKLSNVKILVGYPPLLDDVFQLRNTFKELRFTRDNFLQNQINLLKFNQKRRMEFLRKPETYTEWEVLSPMSLISFYVYRRNALLVPLGGFMYPLFSSFVPEALNYATMGIFISHELGHSVDFVGRTRDAHGRANATLWDESTVADFVERVLCRVNEYSESHYPINGLLTIAEVMADDGSVINSYNTAYEQLQSTIFPGHLRSLMDRMDFSADQLFFLYYAQLFCTSSPDGAPIKGVEHYPPHSVRVTATLTKNIAFHIAFKCPPGSGMNPNNDTCNIW